MFNLVSYHELLEVKSALKTRIEQLEARLSFLEAQISNMEDWAEHLTDAIRGK